jgi:hypothetical protein
VEVHGDVFAFKGLERSGAELRVKGEGRSRREIQRKRNVLDSE